MVAGVSENRRKKWFPLARKSVSTSGNKVIFSKIEFPLAEKNVKIKEYCFKWTENWSPLVGIENLFKTTFLLNENSVYIGRNI